MQNGLPGLCIVSVLALIYGSPCWAKDSTIVVIEPQKVLDGTNEGKKIKDALGEYIKARQRIIEQEEDDLKQKQEELAKQDAVLSPQAKQGKGEELRQRVAAYQNHLQQLEEEVQSKRKELLGEFTDRIEQVVREIAEKDKIDLVLDKGDSGAGAMILFSQSAINLTDRVIKALDGKSVNR